MKITHIEKNKDDVYIITREPSTFMEKLRGGKMEITKYKKLKDKTYQKNSQQAYIAEDGEILDYNDEVITVIENYERKF